MALICQNCGKEKGNLAAAYSSSCHPSSQYLNSMETTEVFFEVVLSTSSLGLPLTAGDDGGAMAVNFYSPSRAMLCWMECQASDEKSWQER
jgi:hypothetical protein